MFLYETHLHTYPTSACSLASPEEMARFYKEKNYTGIIVTDHFLNGNTGCPRNIPWQAQITFFAEGYERAKREGDKIGLDVFFGLEYSIEGSDFLIYGLSPKFLKLYENFDRLPLPKLSKIVRAENAYIAQAHPFRTAFWISSPGPAAAELLDGIETHNASMSDKVNKQAWNFAEKHNLPKQSGSDAHDAHLRRPAGISMKKRAENIFDIIAAIKAGEVELVC